jgi:hypothetical protein
MSHGTISHLTCGTGRTVSREATTGSRTPLRRHAGACRRLHDSILPLDSSGKAAPSCGHDPVCGLLIAMSAIPNLYLKWRAFRELIGMPLSDAQIGAQIFGEGREGAPKFSKLIYGDYGCSPEIAVELASIINKRLDTSRRGRGLPALDAGLKPGDLTLPLHAFIRRLEAIVETSDADSRDRAQQALLSDLAPAFGQPGSARLVVERFSMTRSMGGFLPSGGDGPIIFEAGKHKGRLAVRGIDRQPAMAYTFLARDPRPLGQHSWDFNWSETLSWLPSPSRPAFVEGELLLMPQAAPINPTPGRFLATSVLLWDETARAALDPRGASADPDALDEAQTSRFLTNLRRLQRRKPEAVTASGAEYEVRV